jgi:hypothetical protein
MDLLLAPVADLSACGRNADGFAQELVHGQGEISCIQVVTCCAFNGQNTHFFEEENLVHGFCILRR